MFKSALFVIFFMPCTWSALSVSFRLALFSFPTFFSLARVVHSQLALSRTVLGAAGNQSPIDICLVEELSLAICKVWNSPLELGICQVYCTCPSERVVLHTHCGTGSLLVGVRKLASSPISSISCQSTVWEKVMKSLNFKKEGSSLLDKELRCEPWRQRTPGCNLICLPCPNPP